MAVSLELLFKSCSFGITELLTLLVVLCSGLWLWFRHHYSYWQRHNMPHVKPNPLFGNFKDIIMSHDDPCNFFNKLYNHEMAKGQAALGLYVFNKPCLLIRDLELAKAILIRDFNKFSNRYSSSDPHSDSLGSDNLFFAKNPKWKDIRVKITPVFTSGKIKQMFPLIEEIGREYDRYLCNLPVDPKTNSTMVELKDINSLYSTDVIAITAYGIRANSLRNPDGDFRTNGKRIFHFTWRRSLEFRAMFFLPSLVKLCRFKVFSKQTSQFLRETINYVMNERIKSGHTRNDLIDILIKFRQQAEAEQKRGETPFILERDCLAAQAAIFFSAGFETSSATMSFCMFELSRNREIQNRLRAEIRETLKTNDGNLSYDVIMEMKYLNNVIQEVLRFYPPLPFLDRQCTLQKDEEGYSLNPHYDFKIPNGMPVYIPVCSYHMDEKYFPNPKVFDPDRFAPENKHNINMSAYMPFGTGPHNCIGERFGLIQTKIGLVNFFRNHYVTPCEKSHSEMKLDPLALIIQSEGGIYCNVVRDPLI